MIVDAHAHIATWGTLKECKDTLLESMEKYAIGFSLVSDCDCSEYPTVGDKDVRISQIEGLKKVIAFAKRYPNKIGAAFWINPHNEKVTPELYKLIEKNRKYIFAIKFHPFESHLKISSPKLKPYLELARHFNLPLMVHTAADNYSDIAMLADVAIKNPDLVFVAAHLQLCSDNKDGYRALKKAPNLYADTAWVTMGHAKKVLTEIGEDRIMFGSDNPIDGIDTLGNPMYEAYFHNKCKLPGRLYHNLMYRNAIKIYHLPLNNN
jgi:predicted TIM-barrel fold metal-dependent hydrolase